MIWIAAFALYLAGAVAAGDLLSDRSDKGRVLGAIALFVVLHTLVFQFGLARTHDFGDAWLASAACGAAGLALCHASLFLRPWARAALAAVALLGLLALIHG